jgi:hypothetical protein
MMENLQTTPAKTEQTNQPIQLVTPPQPHIENPENWMRYGNSPQAEIILAVAVLISSISGLLQVLLPVILRQPQNKTR